ncbi:hypothetical protein EGW08_001376 [Elysia chlorotica]|uniref:Uncharacterized protein n=1 Tax=Elysia chlorotica TaxID=188477 RepID=A0A3S1A0P9_ELYCH|nr:hypothetical protein EGW08_001376 [Elysia chlorotica]
MELANLTYRSGGGDGGGTMSDSEMSMGRRRQRNFSHNGTGRSDTLHHDQARNLPIYLLEQGRLPGIPKGRKVRKRKPHQHMNGMGGMGMKAFDIIDTNRTDISKMSSDFHIADFVDTNRTMGTEGSDLDYQYLLPHHHQLLPGPTPYSRTTPFYTDGHSNNISAAADARFPELNPLTPINLASNPANTNAQSSSSTLKIAQGYGPTPSQHASPQPKGAGSSTQGMSFSPARWAGHSDLALPLGRASVKGLRRSQGDPRPPDSAPSLDQSPSRLKQVSANTR